MYFQAGGKSIFSNPQIAAVVELASFTYLLLSCVSLWDRAPWIFFEKINAALGQPILVMIVKAKQKSLRNPMSLGFVDYKNKL